MASDRFPSISPARRLERLADPTGPVDVVLDTDTTNEIDDQFAIVWALLRPDRLRLQALTACPYGISAEFLSRPGALARLDMANLERRLARAGIALADVPTFPPSRGVARAEADLHHWLDVCDVAPHNRPVVAAGAPSFLPDADTPVDSPAARTIIELAHAEREGPLYVAGIGCATNIASALLLDPSIVEEIVVVWTSAHPTFWPYPNASFNMFGDLAAARILFDSGVPLHYQPGYYVGEELRVSKPEIDEYVRPHGPVGRALSDLYDGHVLGGKGAGSSKVIWDLIVPAWLLDPTWLATELVPTPSIGDDARWVHRPDAPLMLESIDVARDRIFTDLYATLEAAAPTSLGPGHPDASVD